jgi:hypothetical protein
MAQALWGMLGGACTTMRHSMATCTNNLGCKSRPDRYHQVASHHTCSLQHCMPHGVTTRHSL